MLQHTTVTNDYGRVTGLDLIPQVTRDTKLGVIQIMVNKPIVRFDFVLNHRSSCACHDFVTCLFIDWLRLDGQVTKS